MRKYLIFIVMICFMIPVLDVSAEGCNVTIDSNTRNFSNSGCSISQNTKFYYENTNYTNYFIVEGSLVSINDIAGLMSSLPTTVKVAKIEMKNDGKVIGIISVKNSNYVEPSTSTTTSTSTAATTTQVGQPTYTVILIHNDGTNEQTQRVCTVSGNDGECTVNLPNLEIDNFNGWGTASSCKDGSRGSIRVEKDTTLYACYDTQEPTTSSEIPMLESLTLYKNTSDEELDFGAFSIKKNDYEFTVENDVKSINVDYEVDSGIEVIVSGNDDLKDGENVVTIKLIGENEKENLYTFIVTRLKSGETIDTNRYLASLNVGYSLNFNKKVFEYTLTIPNDVTSLEINSVPENSGDQVIDEGNENLVNGSVIKLHVTGEDGSSTTYTIKIVKETKDNTIIMIAAGVIVFIILILTFVVFIKAHKKNNGNGSSSLKDTTQNKEKPEKVKKEKKSKKSKNSTSGPEVLPENKNDIEILKF